MDWSLCFLLNASVAATSGVIICVFIWQKYVKRPRVTSYVKFTGPHNIWVIFSSIFTKIDVIGVILTLGSVTSFSLALQYGGQQDPWTSFTVIGLLVSFCLLSTAVVLWEYALGHQALGFRQFFRRRGAL